jgi:hypothetical protein
MANKLGSENIFPIIRILEDATPPSTPPTGEVHFYVDESTKTLHGLDDAAVDIDYGATAITDIVDLPTSETDDALVLAPDGAGGVEWVTPAGGGGGDHVIDEAILGSAAATVDFTSIPDTFRSLFLEIAGASSRTAIEVDELGMRVGTGGTIDTGGNYGYHRWLTGAGTTGAGTNSGASRLELGWMPADSAAAGMMGLCTVEIARYASTSYMKSMTAQSSAFGNTEQYISIGGGVWRNAADPIDCIRVYLPSAANLKTGTRVTLYGRG